MSTLSNSEQQPPVTVGRGEATPRGRPFPKGVSGNPGGRPVGSRNKLTADFARELAEDFAVNGRAAIVACRETEPVQYLKVIASLMPKDVNISARPFTEFTDDDLYNALRQLQSDRGNSAGTGTTIEGEATVVVPALPEAAPVPRGGQDASGAAADGG